MFKAVKVESITDSYFFDKGLKLSLPHILHSYIYTPIGCILVLMILYGINKIIEVIGIQFPASVCLMLINFGFLLCCSQILGKKKTSSIVKIIEFPAGFALKWINIFFTPSFVTLPLSDPITVKEAFIIAAVFVIGYIVMSAFIAYCCVLLQRILGLNKKDFMDGSLSELKSMRTSNSEEEDNSLRSVGTNNLEIEMDEILPTIETNSTLREPSKVFDPKKPSIENQIQVEQEEESLNRETISQMVNNLPDRSKRISLFVSNYFDWLIYVILFIVGLPIYYACDYALPLHLAVGVLWFFTAMLVSPKWRRFFHPILVSVAGVLLTYYILLVIKRDGFMDTLRRYKTGRNYLYLFNTSKSHHWPGAGDVFTSLMDVAIVSLSLPMFQYREDLKKHFFVLIPPVLVCSFGSFFVYPPLCSHIGISPTNSLGFVGRSVTLALGTPLVQALNGSIPLMAVCTIVSGILGVLCGDLLLGKYGLRIKKDDYVTRGVTLGVNCGAISTAHLLNVDPRAAAMSSLSFVIFGTVMVVLSAIRPLAKLIQGWAGL